MADLKRCDRCGEIFEPYKAGKVPETIIGSQYRLKEVFPASISYSRYTNDHYSQWDICPNCAKEFRDFMRAPKEKDGVKND